MLRIKLISEKKHFQKRKETPKLLSKELNKNKMNCAKREGKNL